MPHLTSISLWFYFTSYFRVNEIGLFIRACFFHCSYASSIDLSIGALRIWFVLLTSFLGAHSIGFCSPAHLFVISSGLLLWFISWFVFTPQRWELHAKCCRPQPSITQCLTSFKLACGWRHAQLAHIILVLLGGGECVQVVHLQVSHMID